MKIRHTVKPICVPSRYSEIQRATTDNNSADARRIKRRFLLFKGCADPLGKYEFELTFNLKSLFRRHYVEARVFSRDSGVLVGSINQSSSVSLRFTCFNFISYILWFTLFTSSPRSGGIRWGIRFHRFFGHI